MRDTVAGLVAVLLVFLALSLATTLQYYRRRRERARDSERALGPPQTGADCDDGDHRRSARPVRARAACSPSACSIALPLPDELCATARMADARNRLGDQSFPLVGRTGFAIMTRLRSFKAISFDDGFEIHFASAPIGSEPSRC